MPLHFLAAGLLGVVLLGADIFLAAWLFSEENSPGTAMAGEGPPLEGASTPGYALAKDNTGKLSVEVPEEWSAIDGTAWDFRGGKIGLGIIATNDLNSWYQHNYYHEDSEGIGEAPGVLFGVSSSLVDKYPENTEDQILNLKEYDYTGTCEYDDCHDYDDGTYKGKYDVWTKCGETDANVFVLAALPKDRGHVAVIQITAGNKADLEARKHVLDTFKVADNL
jgi:serine protease Do